METTGFREMENSILKVLRVFLFKSMKQVTFRMNLFTYILLKTLRSNDADGNENVKRIIGFIRKKTSAHVHHALLYISLPVFARLRRENA